MSLLLTVYNSSVWNTFVNVSGLTLIADGTPDINSKAAILQPVQSLATISVLLSSLPGEQKLWLAVVQAEYFIANALESGCTLKEAAQAWQQQTNELLILQRQQRKKLHLFNLHQALAHPAQFSLLLSAEFPINGYPEQTVTSSLQLLAASQYLAQNSELQALNTRLQASVLPLCDSEKLILNIDQILLRNHLKIAAADERDLIQSQLHDVQEQLELKIATHEKELTSIIAEFDQTQNELKKITAEYREGQESFIKLESNIKVISEERDLILTQLQNVQEQLEQCYFLLQTEQQSNKHTLLARDKQHAKEITKLDAELRKTKAKAANAEFAGQLLQQELDKLRKSISWKAAKPVRVLGRLLKKNDPTQEKLTQDVGLLLTSEYFDVNWYLRTYTDVAEHHINPAEHYLRHGAAEGRLPGPLFDGNWYRQHYPDVAEANINPLLHFILYGQQEGRSSSPILLTNNSQDVEE